jgi:hypothetical protein
LYICFHILYNKLSVKFLWELAAQKILLMTIKDGGKYE